MLELIDTPQLHMGLGVARMIPDEQERQLLGPRVVQGIPGHADLIDPRLQVAGVQRQRPVQGLAGRDQVAGLAGLTCHLQLDGERGRRVSPEPRPCLTALLVRQQGNQVGQVIRGRGPGMRAREGQPQLALRGLQISTGAPGPAHALMRRPGVRIQLQRGLEGLHGLHHIATTQGGRPPRQLGIHVATAGAGCHQGQQQKHLHASSVSHHPPAGATVSPDGG